MALSSSEKRSSGYTGFKKLDTTGAAVDLPVDLLRELLTAALAGVGDEERANVAVDCTTTLEREPEPEPEPALVALAAAIEAHLRLVLFAFE